MTKPPLMLMVDTNVWLDLYIPHRPGAAVSKSFLQAAIRHEANLLFTMQAAYDVYASVGVNHKRWVRESKGELDEEYVRAIKSLAWDCVENMRELATVVGADASDLWMACKYRDLHDDLEDDIVLAACKRAKADILVTNDAKLIHHAPVCAMTPADVIKLFDE